MNRHLVWLIVALVLTTGGLIFWGRHHAMTPAQSEAHEKVLDQK